MRISRELFEGISLDVAYELEIDQDDVMRAYDNDEVHVFANEAHAFKFIYTNDKTEEELKELIMDLAMTGEVDVVGYTNLMNKCLEEDYRVCTVEGMVVFINEL